MQYSSAVLLVAAALSVAGIVLAQRPRGPRSRWHRRHLQLADDVSPTFSPTAVLSTSKTPISLNDRFQVAAWQWHRSGRTYEADGI